MRIDSKKCVGCRLCIYYCPEAAIKIAEGNATINEARCVECGACLRSSICPTEAICENPIGWPRTVRHVFSSVLTVHRETNVPGRGTEEMKTNDVTGRFQRGEAGFSVDVGRPGLGVSFEDVEKIAMAVAEAGVEFEPRNPVTMLMADRRSGRIRDDVKGERLHSCVMEFKTRLDRLPSVVRALNDVAGRVKTVFSVGCCCRVESDGTIPVKRMLDKHRIVYRPNGKTNVGLGRPLMESRGGLKKS